MKKVVVLVSGVFPFLANAECVPVTDCALIGYTETSCDGDSIKCPFDTSKLKCIPCDSSFRYSCEGENVTGGIGDICNGKYTTCECVKEEYVFDKGKCVCPNITISECLVGAIYYPNGKCSNKYISCQNPVGVVVKDNALIMSWKSVSAITWASNTTFDTPLENMSSSKAIIDYNGKTNTAVIVSAYPNDTSANNASIYCNEYAPIGMESTKGRWYLPAMGELYSYMYENLNILNNLYNSKLGFVSYWFWSSSEQTNYLSWRLISHDGKLGGGAKDDANYVTCFLEIN